MLDAGRVRRTNGRGYRGGPGQHDHGAPAACPSLPSNTCLALIGKSLADVPPPVLSLSAGQE